MLPLALVKPVATSLAKSSEDALIIEEQKVREFLEVRGIPVTMGHNTWCSTVTKTQWTEDLPGGGHETHEKEDINNADSKWDED